jgi:hypothetical protein
MAKIFEANQWTDGTFSVVAHATKGVTLKGGDGTMDAGDAEKALNASLAYATKNSVGLDKWSFYVEGESQKQPKSDITLPVSVIEKALKKNFVVSVEAGKWSKPRLTLRPEGSTGKKATAAKPKAAVIA